MAGATAGVGLVVGALSHIGPHDVDSDDIAHLCQVLTAKDKQALRRIIPRLSEIRANKSNSAN